MNNWLFFVWFILGNGFIFLPRVLLAKISWLSSSRFIQIHSDKEWLVSSYKLVLILWLSLSTIFTARYFQSSTFPSFFLFVAFIPLIGVGLLKGFIEIVFDVSSQLGWRRLENRPFQLRILRTEGMGLEMLEYRFVKNEDQIKRVGLLRVIINLGLLLSLLYFY